MSKRKRFTYEEKLAACQFYEAGNGSQQSTADEFGMKKSFFKAIYFKYVNFGPKYLKMQKTNQSYTKEFKQQVVDSYHNEEGSYTELAVKYRIPNASVIASWVLGYNNSNKTTYSGIGGVTMKSRKTTHDERIRIVGYLIDNDVDYNKTSTHFGVSYQQVYQWYKKYLEKGVIGLVDNRGRKKQEVDLSEIELLKRENERLKRELELSKATELVFKKKEEFEEKTRLQKLEMKRRIK